MAPTDIRPRSTAPIGQVGGHRARAVRRRRMVLSVLLLGLVAVVVAVALSWTMSDDTSSDATRPTRRGSSSTTTTHTTTTTTVAPVPTSVPGVTVGPLIGGPGPVPVIHRVPTKDPVVFITIDDGVTAEPDALNVIRDNHLPVTMFLNQMYLRHNGDYFRQIQDLGGVIGSHTTSHANLKGKDPAFQHGQICDLVPEFQSRFGAAPDMFRPPYGNYDPVTIEQAASCGIKYVVQWSATGDTGSIVTADGPLRAGDIILLHFKPGLGLRLRNILAQVAAAGLRPAQLADYLRSAPPAPPAAPTTTVLPLPETGAAVPPAP